MMHGPASQYVRSIPIEDVNALHAEQSTRGQRVADAVTRILGGWTFIIWQSIFLVAWIILNIYMAWKWSTDVAFDPYPFILLNLVLSFQGAYTGPIVMMSQNRQNQRDRLMAEHTYNTALRTAQEVDVILAHLLHQDAQIDEIGAKVGVKTTFTYD